MTKPGRCTVRDDDCKNSWEIEKVVEVGKAYSRGLIAGVVIAQEILNSYPDEAAEQLWHRLQTKLAELRDEEG